MVLESVRMMVNANVVQDILEAIVKKWKLQKVAFYVSLFHIYQILQVTFLKNGMKSLSKFTSENLKN
jgi:hypothetical protein